MYSKSVLSENQYLGIMLCVIFAPCLIGSLLGILYAKYAGKRRMLYFIPVLIFLIAYIAMLVLGFGMVSIKEVIWLLLFLISVFLTMFAGLVPSRVAANKDPVESLRSE